MPGSFTREEREAAVERLVRMRIDREGGAGTYADAVSRIGANDAASAGLKSALDRARDRATRNVADVLAALAGDSDG
jgi:hypothetical protein